MPEETTTETYQEATRSEWEQEFTRLLLRYMDAHRALQLHMSNTNRIDATIDAAALTQLVLKPRY